MPASCRVQGPGEMRMRAGFSAFNFLRRNLVVALDDHLGKAELAQILDEVVREGVVVVEDEDHDQLILRCGRLQAFDDEPQDRFRICSRVTSNCSMTSSMFKSSRFSNTVTTGRRVLRKTHAPLTLPGMLSTAGH